MFKQELPPEGGYAPITYKRVPIKPGFSAITKIGIVMGITAAGGFFFQRTKDRINIERIEMRCSRLALRPMVEAEVDRMHLKQLKRNRDAEEIIMKDVKGWEVGKWEGCPVYLSIGPDEYFKPVKEEYYAHAPRSWYQLTKSVTSQP